MIYQLIIQPPGRSCLVLTLLVTLSPTSLAKKEKKEKSANNKKGSLSDRLAASSAGRCWGLLMSLKVSWNFHLAQLGLCLSFLEKYLWLKKVCVSQGYFPELIHILTSLVETALRVWFNHSKTKCLIKETAILAIPDKWWEIMISSLHPKPHTVLGEYVMSLIGDVDSWSAESKMEVNSLKVVWEQKHTGRDLVPKYEDDSKARHIWTPWLTRRPSLFSQWIRGRLRQAELHSTWLRHQRCNTPSMIKAWLIRSLTPSGNAKLTHSELSLSLCNLQFVDMQCRAER